MHLTFFINPFVLNNITISVLCLAVRVSHSNLFGHTYPISKDEWLKPTPIPQHQFGFRIFSFRYIKRLLLLTLNGILRCVFKSVLRGQTIKSKHYFRYFSVCSFCGSFAKPNRKWKHSSRLSSQIATETHTHYT